MGHSQQANTNIAGCRTLAYEFHPIFSTKHPTTRYLYAKRYEALPTTSPQCLLIQKILCLGNSPDYMSLAAYLRRFLTFATLVLRTRSSKSEITLAEFSLFDS